MSDVERKLRELGERTDERLRHGEVPRARLVRRVRLRRGVAAAGTLAVVALVAAVAIPRLEDVRRDRRVQGSGIDLAAVAQTTEDEGTARMALEMTIDVSGRQATTSAAGVVDFERARAHFNVEETGLLGTEPIEMVLIGRTTFQRVLGQDGDEPSKWYETTTPGAGVGLPTFGMGSPSDFLSSLASQSEDVTDLGEEVVDGVTVTHYRAEIDLQYPAPTKFEFDLEPMDVWVDAEGRLRRLTFALTTTGAPGPSSAETTMRLWDFGIPVDVVAPDPEDVTDEPPPALGAAPGMEHSVADEDTGELDEFGVGEFFTVTGEEGSSGPHAIVTVSEGHVAVCIQGAPAATSRSTIVEVGSGDVVVSTPGDPKETNPYARGGCQQSGLSTDLADQLRSHRELFELRFERAGRPDVVVPLTHTF